ncbi:hypothetical protein ACC810_38175, partial [Rhizobium ruizarguesonis]
MRDIVYWILCAFLTVAIAMVSLLYVTNFWLLSFVYSFQVHLAEQAGVRYSLENPEAYLRSNVEGSWN